MAALPRPSVQVIQVFETTSPTILVPTLRPHVTGPGFEVIEVQNTDGTVNTDARDGVYDQFQQNIAQSSFPSPRANISQVDVLEETIRAFISFGGSLTELDNGDDLYGDGGSSFLAFANWAFRPAFISEKAGAGFAFGAGGDNLVLAIDNVVRTATANDIVVTLTGAMTAAQVAAAINAAVGTTVADVVDTDRVRIMSANYGATASVLVRIGSAASTILYAGLSGATVEYYTIGAGFRGQDDGDSDTETPWIEYFRGDYQEDGVSAAWTGGPAVATGASLVPEDDVAIYDQAPARTFAGASPDVPLQAANATRPGDQFYGDGVQIAAGEVIEAQTGRFRLGVLDAVNSIFDDDGNPTTRVYTAAEIGNIFDTSPLAPRNAWFRALGLIEGSVAPTPVAATLLGTALGSQALLGYLVGAGVDNTVATGVFPLNLTGKVLYVNVTVDGVAQAQEQIVLTGPYANMAAVAADVTGQATNFLATAYSDATPAAELEYLTLATLLTGDDQQVTVDVAPANSGHADLGYGTISGSGIGKDVEFGTPAVLTNTGPVGVFPGGLIATDKLEIRVTDRNGTNFDIDYELTAGDLAGGTWVALAAALNAGGAGTLISPANGRPGIPMVFFTGDDTPAAETFTVTTWQASETASIVDVASDAGFLFAAGAVAAANVLTAAQFGFTLDSNPFIWTTTFISESLEDAIDKINEAVNDNVVARVGGGSSRQLRLTSLLLGQASAVAVQTGGVYAATSAAFGMASPSTAAGSGRPDPDFYLDLSGGAVIGAQILRDGVTGIPFNNEYLGSADVYLAYRGLRLDLSPLATTPALLVIEDTTQLSSLMDPISTNNPLALGLFFAKLNAPTVSVTGMGVGAVSAAQPMGTLTAYTAVAEFLESEEVYAIVPLTHEATIHQLFKTHVDAMSAPALRGERILFFNPEVPSERTATVAASGTDGNTTATDNQFITDENPSAQLIANGINPALPIPVSDGLYLEVTVSGELRRYNVSAVNGALLTLNVTFTGSQNTDGFYTTTTLNVALVSVAWSLKIRGASLTVAGQPDLAGIVTTVAGVATTYNDRRLYMIFPDEVTAELDEGTSLIAGYYAGAAIAGMVGQQLPQQGFTNYPITGFSAVQGSNDTFSESQLDDIAGGGVYILVQDFDGAPIISRHQLSTAVSTIETRELSITKDVDFVAKVLRASLRNFLGIFNVTPQYLDTLTAVTEGLLEFLKVAGALIGYQLNSITQDTTNPDTVLIDVTLDIPYPANYIRITLRI